MSTVPVSDVPRQPHHMPALFDGIIPVIRDDDTIAIYGVDIAGQQCDQPLAVLDPFDTAMLATAIAAMLKQVRGL